MDPEQTQTQQVRKPQQSNNSQSTPKSGPNTRSRSNHPESYIEPITAEKRKRSVSSSREAGNMSKKSAAEVEPTNALIMRTLTNMNARFDKLPTVEHLNKLEADLHGKLEASTKALKSELRAEFRAEMNEQANKVNEMISEVKAQVATAANEQDRTSRNNNQMGRYLRARRSFKIWPVRVEGSGEVNEEKAVRKFFIKEMQVPVATAQSVPLDTIRRADQARNSRITDEYVISFADAESRDIIKSYASGLAASKGQAGLRLDIPPCLKGSFQILNDHGISMVKIYGKEVKRNIKFDDRNLDLMMDIKLPTSNTWHNITIEQAREAKKARDMIDIRNIRQAALAGPSASQGEPAMNRDKARALMLAISPNKEASGSNNNFGSKTGVVYINSSQDWRNFESQEDGNATDESIEEILGAATRGGNRKKTNSQNRS